MTTVGSAGYPGRAGLVTFRLGGRDYATPLDAVREVVRLRGLAELPGMAAPLAGVLDLRGAALPVLDLRPSAAGSRGDVLVLDRSGPDATASTPAGDQLDAGPAVDVRPATDDGPAADDGSAGRGLVGVAVDQVLAVLPAAELSRAGAGASGDVLPSYVVDVLRGRDGVVFLVDLEQMVRAAGGHPPPQT